ncbi:uncharacterized protein [Nicotiana sylvestris]|uniref:uncharacterized protein n=1 Tax=Nicotiana sylvestris TaxID=4096 RepID=UPI00388CC696
MARTRTPSSARRGTTRDGDQVGVHQTRRQIAPQPEVGNMGQPQAAMPDQVQGQGVQDAPPPVPTAAPIIALPVDAVARLLNVLEALVPAQGGSSVPRTTFQTQAPAQTQTFGNKEVSLQDFLKLKSPKFTGSDNSVDPQSFLDGTLKALRALVCSSERAVELETYKLEDMANTWYETVLLGRPAGVAPLTWDEFTKLFKNHFLPDSLPTEEARVQRFVDGLVGHLYTAVSPQMNTLSYSNVVDLARKIENKGCDERAASDLRKKLGHHLRDFPQPPRNFNQASIQSTVPTQTTRNTSSATGTGNRGRGVGDRATVNQGQGNAGRGQARVFAFTRQDAQASNAVVTGSTHSYVSSYFALRFSRQPELLNDPFLVATPIRESLLAEYMYRACQIRVEGRDTLADLIVLDMIDFDMLMGMDWLSSCYAIVDCHAKIVKFEIPNEPGFILRGS